MRNWDPDHINEKCHFVWNMSNLKREPAYWMKGITTLEDKRQFENQLITINKSSFTIRVTRKIRQITIFSTSYNAQTPVGQIGFWAYSKSK